MINVADYLLDRSSASLLLFMAGAALAALIRLSPAKRVGAGLAAIALAASIPISTRSGFEWIVSAIGRPSAPGLLLLATLAVATVIGRNLNDNRECRFATGLLAITGFILYPGATGYLDFDTYALGYSGYVLPAALVAILAYALYRRYFFVVAALDVAIIAFLLSAGRSNNLWDYVIDPVAWLIGIGTWIFLLVRAVVRRSKASLSIPVQTSS
jgi:hypothetical protein